MRSLSTCSDRASGSGALGRLRLTALGLLAFLLFAGLPTSAWTAVGAHLSALADSHALARITTCSPCSVADGAKPGATYTYDGRLHSSLRMHALPHVTAPAGDIASRSMHGVIAERAAATATGVAAEAGGGARFVVGAGGETTMYLRAGSESLEVTEHAALRMTQRGISIDAAESTLGQPSFQYFHQGVWKTGYYDPSSRIFIGTVDGRLTTVINNATPNYIANLQAATP